MKWWQKVISEPSKFILQVAELGAIYILEKYKGRGIGFSLLSSGFKQMKERGFTEAYCWVLEGNPTTQFYERTGAAFRGKIKEVEIGVQKVKELAYHWDTLDI